MNYILKLYVRLGGALSFLEHGFVEKTPRLRLGDAWRTPSIALTNDSAMLGFAKPRIQKKKNVQLCLGDDLICQESDDRG